MIQEITITGGYLHADLWRSSLSLNLDGAEMMMPVGQPDRV